MKDIEIVFRNFGRKCIMSEDGTTNYHIGRKRRHIIRIRLTYKTRNRICITDVRKVHNGIWWVPRNCVTAGERFVLELPTSRATLAIARPLVERWQPFAISYLWGAFWDDPRPINAQFVCCSFDSTKVWIFSAFGLKQPVHILTRNAWQRI